jgi:hypothetical protein
MTYPPKPYRSDLNARISYALHHRTLEIAVIVLAVTGAATWLVTMQGGLLELMGI